MFAETNEADLSCDQATFAFSPTVAVAGKKDGTPDRLEDGCRHAGSAGLPKCQSFGWRSSSDSGTPHGLTIGTGPDGLGNGHMAFRSRDDMSWFGR